MEAQRCDVRSTLEIRQHVLLDELRSATIYWFRSRKALTTNAEDDAIQMVVSSCMNILQNGFRLNLKSTFYHATNGPTASKQNDSMKRLIDDFEFLRMLYASGSKPAEMSSTLQSAESVDVFLRSWVVRCLMTHSLTQCLQSLVTDKELLEYYYSTEAFLRQSNYATALFICLSAIELNQYNILSQLDVQLLQSPHILLKPQKTLHRRTISHPNFSVSPHKLSTVQEEVKTTNLITSTPQRTVAISSYPLFRRIKSLPCIELDTTPTTTALRRCKTFTTPNAETTSIKRPAKSFKSMHKQSNYSKFVQTSLGSSLSPSLYSTDELDMLPSTSAGSKRSQTSTESSGTCNSLASSSSINSNASNQRIQLINCDNIKIWTDQSLEQQQQQSVLNGVERKLPPTNAHKIRKKQFQSKSSSPINNFFANLFGSPPAYTSWSLNYTENCSNDNVHSQDGIAVLDTFLPIYGKKLRKRNSQNLFQDGVSILDYTTTPTTSGSNIPCHSSTTPVDIMPHASVSTLSSRSDESIPKADNQSLAAFLQMSRFSRNDTDLEKENAHFRISEACISAIEHVKWAKQKQEKTEQNSNGNNSSTSPCTNNTELTSSSSCENIPYAEMGDNGRELLSAENVGLTLISKFNDKQLPKASDLKWLVSEDDTPQKMLPMPVSYTETQPDDVMPSMTRGTKFWAPPRQQIIFTEHLPLNRMDLMHKQNYRCAGCGMRVTKQFIQLFRFCTYLGKYLCTGCHRNQISAIPAKILQAWDFRCYPVSVFAYRLIEQMYTFPLFYVPDLNPKLYTKFGVLAIACHKRRQLKLIKDFIKTCRFATREQIYFQDVPDHITADPDMWSMADFVDVQHKSMHRSIDELIALCEEHVLNCVLCTGRGFVCEYCKDQYVLYTWQSKVQRCLHCGACYHQKCWKSMSETCPRCERINKRQNNS